MMKESRDKNIESLVMEEQKGKKREKRDTF